jgi:hypothetical protein
MKRGQSVAYIYVELSRQSLHDRNLDQTMAFLDAAFAAKADPLIAHNQAIYLLTAGLPGPAMDYLRKSESTRQPAFKAWLLDIPGMNAPLWDIARRMQAMMTGSGADSPRQAH